MPGLKFRELATGAFAVTIALAWNEAVSTSIRSLYPNGGARATIAYAVVITMLVILVVGAVNLCAHHFGRLRGGSGGATIEPLSEARDQPASDTRGGAGAPLIPMIF